MARRRKKSTLKQSSTQSTDDDFMFSLKSEKGSPARISSVLNNSRLVSVLSVILLLAIAFGVSWHYRAYTYELPITEDWATNNVHTYYQNLIRQQVDQQYPNLPAASKNEIVQTEFQKFKAENQAGIDQNIKDAQTHFLKQFQDDTGRTYILNIDSFYFLQRMNNIVEKGHVHDSVRNGIIYDDYMLAPKGLRTNTDFHTLFSAYLYKFMNFFNRNLRVSDVAFIVSILVASLSIIPAFFIVRKKTGNFGGFFAALVLALHPVFMGRSMAGDFDNDTYNILFPLIIAWVFLEAIEAKSFRNKLILTALNGFLIGAFAFAWRGGWWYLFDFVLAVMLIYIWYLLIRQMIDKMVQKNYLRMSAFWSRLLLFFGPLTAGALLFLANTMTGIVFFSIYALAILTYYVIHMAGAIKKYLAKKDISDEIFQTSVILILFIGVSALFVTMFANWSVFYSGPLSPLRITTLQDPAKFNLWPNVYTTVAELNVTNISGVINQIGTITTLGAKYHLFFVLATMGIIMGLVRKKMGWKDISFIAGCIIYYLIITRPWAWKLASTEFLLLYTLPMLLGLYLLLKDRTVDIKYAVFLMIWFVATMYAGTRGIRFIILLIPAFSVALGVAIGTFYNLLVNLGNRELNIGRNIMKAGVGILLLLLLIQPLQGADRYARNHVPIFDRTWYEAMDAIKQDSQPDAIINSWWDFGHFFKAIGDRPVTFDGAIQNTPPAHWIGLALTTSSEAETVGILRMLDCGQNDAFDLIMEEFDNSIRSRDLVGEIIISTKQEADNILEREGFSPATRTQILSKSHCDPPENYFVTSGDMIGKAGVWAHFGLWDFKRAFIYNSVRNRPMQQSVNLLTTELGITPESAENYYMQVQSLASDREANSWISPWPGYVTSQIIGCARINATLNCNINLGLGQDAQSTTVLEKAVIFIDEPESSYLHITVFDKSVRNRLFELTDAKPQNFVISGEKDFEKYGFANVSFPHDIVVDTFNNRLLITDPLLSTSTFTKLFFFGGMHMEHFDKVFEKQSSVQGNVIVWKVDWDGKTEEELGELRQKWMPKKTTSPKPEETQE